MGERTLNPHCPEAWALEGLKAFQQAVDRAILGRVHEFLRRARPLIRQSVDYAIAPSYRPGFTKPLLVELDRRPELGELCQFRPGGSVYTVISVHGFLDSPFTTSKVYSVWLDRPLEEAVTCDNDDVVRGRFKSLGRSILGVSILDERLATVMLA